MEFDAEFLINGLKELDPVIFYKDTEARYVFSNHHKEKTKYDNGHEWDIYGKNDLECREDTENAIFVHENDLEMIKNGGKAKYVIKKMVNGKMSYLEIQKSPVYKDGKIVGIVGLIVDITEKVELKQKLEKLANIDPLTGLFNRNYFNQWVSSQNEKELYPLSIISLDCNYLKTINDTLGHNIGDEYIKMVSYLFKMVLPENSISFRMGGDEFLVILPNTVLKQAEIIVSALKEHEKEFKIAGHELSISYGISNIEEYVCSLNAYINEADKNMYEDKIINHSNTRNKVKKINK